MITATAKVPQMFMKELKYMSDKIKGPELTGPTHHDVYKAVSQVVTGNKVVGFFVPPSGVEMAGYCLDTNNGIAIGFTNCTPTNSQGKRTAPPYIFLGYTDDGVNVVTGETALKDYQSKKDFEYEIASGLSMIPPFNWKALKQTELKRSKRDHLMMSLGRLNFRSLNKNDRFMPWKRLGEIERRLNGKVCTLYDFYREFSEEVKKDSPLRQLHELYLFHKTVSEACKSY